MPSLRLTIVQYGGDYRQAFERLSSGGKETYYAQRYSVNLVGSLAQRVEQIAVICAVSETTYDFVLANGVRAIGAGLKSGVSPVQVDTAACKDAADAAVAHVTTGAGSQMG